MPNTSRTRPTALITGASAGIGAELARVFAAHDHDVILVARRRDALEALAGQLEGAHGINATVLVEDLSDPGAPERILAAVQEAGKSVDVLVNNAGFGLGGEFSETPVERELDMIQVNVSALVHLTKLFLVPMVQRKHGYIMNVASTAGFQPGPLMSIYYATKAFVVSFSQAIAEELADSGVKVSALCPGPTATEFADTAEMRVTGLFGGDVADAKSVAEFGYHALMHGSRLAIPGMRNKILLHGQRIIPRRLVTKVIKRIQQKRR